MAPPLLSLQNIALTFGGTPLIEAADLAVSQGDRVCLVGRNGSGKSTLLRIAAGLVDADSGERFVQPGATARYLEQEPDMSGFADVRAYVEAGLAPGDDWRRAERLLEALGLDPARATDNLSGGEARRAALARTLAPAPDIVLLDEPTNHLDLPAIEWLEDELARSRGAVVMVSHDRRFLDNVSRRTVWLDRGRTKALDQGFAGFEAWRDEVYEREALEAHKLDRKIAAEEDWVRYGVTARRKRNVRRMAELDALRQARRETRRAAGAAVMQSVEAKTSGKLVVEADGVCKRFDGRPVVEDFSIKIARGDRVGLAGPNGSGKTTLVRLVTGALAPDEGTVRLGTNLEIATLDQRRAALDPTTPLRAALLGGEGGGRGDMIEIGGTTRHVMSYLKDFLFQPEQARTPVGALSGGERGRLALAMALARPSNLLVLDEPTNDLDLETLDVLQEMLGDYAGTILLVSHDRDFLDRVATSIIAPDPALGPGGWREYAGGYSDMVRQRAAAPKPASAKTVRAKPAAPPAKDAAKPARAKLSYKDKHALETLPAKIAALEADIAALAAKLADPELYARDARGFDALAARLANAEAERDGAEEQWLELEMKREELEGGGS